MIGFIPFAQIAHVACGAGYFLAAVMLYEQPLTTPLLAAASAFGLLYLSGSFSNELVDFEVDTKAGLRTLPSVIGRRKTHMLIIAAQLGALLCFALFARDAATSFLLASATGVYLLMIQYCGFTEPDYLRVRMFRSSYRWFFAAVIMLTVGMQLYQKHVLG